MNLQEITSIFNLFGQSDATAMKLQSGDFLLELSREAGVKAPTSNPVGETAAVAAASVEKIGLTKTVNAPLVGTYYAAPSPDGKPFVAVGQQVKRGETLCLIEAMKMMSEVPAPCDCIVEEMLQADGVLLAFDAPILRYRAV